MCMCVVVTAMHMHIHIHICTCVCIYIYTVVIYLKHPGLSKLNSWFLDPARNTEVDRACKSKLQQCRHGF